MARAKATRPSAEEPSTESVTEEVADLVDEAVDPSAVNAEDVEVHAYTSSELAGDAAAEPQRAIVGWLLRRRIRVLQSVRGVGNDYVARNECAVGDACGTGCM